MRFLGLIAVLAIIYVTYTKRLATKPDSTSEAMKEYAQTAPPESAPSQAAAPSAPAPSSSNLRRPIDTTRSVLEKVKQRNKDSDL
jgi:hypothetical protein